MKMAGYRNTDTQRRVFRRPAGEWVTLLLFSLSLFAVAPAVRAEDPKGPPPAKVVVAPVQKGHIAPSVEFVGTTFFVHSSDHASEVSGRIDKVSFEEGDRVKEGQPLAVVNTDLLEKEIQAKEAEHGQILAQITKTALDLKRVSQALKNKAVSEQLYDETFYRQEELRSKAAAVQAEVERLKVQREKAVIRSPFTGIVVKRDIEVGEWVSPGTTVATIADDTKIDVRVNVPQSILPHLRKGLKVSVTHGAANHTGMLHAVMPKGDVLTRTVPISIRVKGKDWIEGVEARVQLPTDEPSEAFIVSRDAVLKVFGQDTLYVVNSTSAKPIVVEVVGYEGDSIGVRAENLEVGMLAVVKGNERLRPEQAVTIVNEGQREGK